MDDGEFYPVIRLQREGFSETPLTIHHVIEGCNLENSVPTTPGEMAGGLTDCWAEVSCTNCLSLKTHQ